MFRFRDKLFLAARKLVSDRRFPTWWPEGERARGSLASDPAFENPGVFVFSDEEGFIEISTWDE